MPIAVAPLACALGLLGCTEFESGSDVLGNGPSGSDAPPGEDWSCLVGDENRPLAPTPVAAESVPRVVYSLQFVDLSTGGVYGDVAVRACGASDPTCANPVTPLVTVDEEGWVDLPLFQNFLGYMEINSPSVLPSMMYMTEPLQPLTPPEYPFALVSLASIGSLVQLVGVPQQAGSGIFSARAFDCRGIPAPNVTFSIDVPGTPYYFVGPLPSGVGTSTDSSGLGGFVNVPPGLAIVDLRAPNGRSIVGPQSIVIRANWLSGFFVRPPGRDRSAPN